MMLVVMMLRYGKVIQHESRANLDLLPEFRRSLTRLPLVHPVGAPADKSRISPNYYELALVQ